MQAKAPSSISPLEVVKKGTQKYIQQREGGKRGDTHTTHTESPHTEFDTRPLVPPFFPHLWVIHHDPVKQ
jgi:hypothetical protein